MSTDKITIKGAREHNLKNVNVTIPRDTLTVITGVSGSGKSSLAFDTLYAEGQRRYVESLSAYARQFLEQMDKPDVDSIEGLSPAISIEQKTVSRNPRSTVGTVTEIYDYLRLLFARIGIPYCYQCGRLIEASSSQQVTDALIQIEPGTRLTLLAPIVRSRKGEHRKELEKFARQGFLRARVDGQILGLDEEILMDRKKKHDIEIVIDRILVKPEVRNRLADSVELALKVGDGLLIALIGKDEETIFSEKLACASCGISYPEISPRFFSFNNPTGACSACSGLGFTTEIDPDLVIPDPGLSIRGGALAPWRKRNSMFYHQLLQALATHFGFDLTVPFEKLPEIARHVVLYGSGSEVINFRYQDSSQVWKTRKPFEGIIPNLRRRYLETSSEHSREEIESFMGNQTCEACRGARLRPESLHVTVGDLNISQVTNFSIGEAFRFFSDLTLNEKESEIASRILKEITERLSFLRNVGLDYLTLDRASGTLSGGEGQRIRLATQIGSSLMGVLYILDEPSIGLHPRDNARLLQTLLALRDMGNTVIVVEHDADTITTADYVVDMGPGAGVRGGEVVAQGVPAFIMNSEKSLTGKYLSGRLSIETPKTRRRAGFLGSLVVTGAARNNLKEIDVSFPLGVFTCVTGVSGSGKSSLVIETLYRALARSRSINAQRPGIHKGIKGTEAIDRVIDIDQSPIGRTPRSNPATYTGAFTPIRELFAQVPESRIRGYKPGRFSFNVKGGRCEACQGDGVKKIEMHFLPDIHVTCEICDGRRFNRETLEITYKGVNIAEVLSRTVNQAAELFAGIPVIARRLHTLQEVGMGYIQLGQAATTLSGGEAQRIKLSRELSKRDTGRTLYILDEPTTGLHFDDVVKLLVVLNNLVQRGNTVIVIEHNLEVIKSADHLIDLGPEGGDKGGYLVATGTPEEVAKVKGSHTGRFLKDILKKSAGGKNPGRRAKGGEKPGSPGKAGSE
ncbi:MAG: excinuclease ABC subunit UvrA [bacterium]|nr:excinuclease ABC subunit UvrA [bacterium]MDT8366912.1 excinuclease ABC subunit UvrA [bacterium]